MIWLREVPVRWWAVMVGIAFGSMALITINGPKEGYGKAVFTAAGIAPLLCVVAGAMLPSETSLEIAALIGGLTALGGTALVLALAKRMPVIVSAAIGAAARSYLEVETKDNGKQSITRIDEKGLPEPDKRLDALAHKLDGENEPKEQDDGP
ncbi:hypothetical protein [Qipengyuania atrilutea]|uniref:Uncharacterized protein n=1 Tax=Qipengyuania atrilutea TaxID=2744473 RepID=A0A850GZ66_9SPHN|nr:hypothetical protein [Actirhodobacter atriluteus]NVD43490.1 hypothetical protein [Actirhodobacter atriluteus]